MPATRLSLVTINVALTLAVAAHGQSEIQLNALTVPEDRLGSECRLSPSSTVPIEGNRVRAGLWAGLPISSNPWQGDERATVAAIRERLEVTPAPPDGPPMSRPELAQFRLKLADDVEEAYAAVYADAGPRLVTVYAVRFKEPRDAPQTRTKASAGAGFRFVRGRTAVVMTGAPGTCLEVVGGHLQELTAR